MSKESYLKQKYIEYLFPEKKADILQQKALELKEAIFPTSIFKYREFDDNNFSIDNLKNNVIYLSHPAAFNDPFDSKFYVDMNVTNKLTDDAKPFLKLIDDELDVKIKKEYLKIKTYIDEDKRWTLIENFQVQFKICSFSTIFDSILMWAHYAKSHTGFCIEYNSLEVEMKKNIIFPILYKEKLLDITNAAMLEEEKRNNTYLIKATLIKSKEWEYEKEWRLIVQPKLERNKKYLDNDTYDMPIPKAICMGLNITEDNKKRLLSICKDKKIPLYQMIKDSKYYKLKYELSDDGTKKDYCK